MQSIKKEIEEIKLHTKAIQCAIEAMQEMFDRWAEEDKLENQESEV